MYRFAFCWLLCLLPAALLAADPTQIDAARFESLERVRILVGGIPRVRVRPYEYKAGFSPADVLEEYTRPARIVEHGAVVVREALSEPELMEFDGVGTLEAFNTDGLRTLLRTQDAPNMEERTLRYPGHAELMRALRAAGFFDERPIDVGDAELEALGRQRCCTTRQVADVDEGLQEIRALACDGEIPRQGNGTTNTRSRAINSPTPNGLVR